MVIKELNRRSKGSGDCNCGKEAMVHTTEYPDEFTCQHLYFCNDCWWLYDKKPRQMAPWQIAKKQEDIQTWKNIMGYK